MEKPKLSTQYCLAYTEIINEAGYSVRITNPEGMRSTDKVTLHISWSDTTNGGDNSESETEE